MHAGMHGTYLEVLPTGYVGATLGSVYGRRRHGTYLPT